MIPLQLAETSEMLGAALVKLRTHNYLALDVHLYFFAVVFGTLPIDWRQQ